MECRNAILTKFRRVLALMLAILMSVAVPSFAEETEGAGAGGGRKFNV